MSPRCKTFLASALTAVLLVGAGCATGPRHPGAGEVIDDSVISVKVHHAIIDEPTLQAAEIDVDTFDGQVQLSGFVRRVEDVYKATEVARRVAGVKTVINALIVRS